MQFWRYCSPPERLSLRSRCETASAAALAWTTGWSAAPQNDRIYAGAGDDKARGGEGDDFIKGESGNDGVYWQEGNDRIKGNVGEDTVFEGPGDDKVRGGSHGKPNDGAKDILDCAQGRDEVYFTDGVDVVSDDCEIQNPPE